MQSQENWSEFVKGIRLDRLVCYIDVKFNDVSYKLILLY